MRGGVDGNHLELSSNLLDRQCLEGITDNIDIKRYVLFMFDASLPLSFKSDALAPESRISALVILNGSPLSKSLLDAAWPSTALPYKCPVICADGAANLLRELDPTRIPTHIVGDLDSAEPEVLAFYKSHNAQIISRPSPLACDFTKAMDEAMVLRTGQEFPILVLGGCLAPTRLDQLFGNIQELCSRAEAENQVWWLCTGSACLVLNRGKHLIRVDASREGPMCGLVPIAGSVASVTTSGLKWNLTAQETRFGPGGLVSSSNEIADAVVSVDTSGLLLWTCEFHVP